MKKPGRAARPGSPVGFWSLKKTADKAQRAFATTDSNGL
jgi:hypothetical protein